MADAVVVLEQLALLAQGAVEVGGGGSGTERGVEALVLQLDDEDVIDLPGRQRGAGDARGGVGGGARLGCRGGEEDEGGAGSRPGR